MPQRVGMEVSLAVSEAAKMANIDVAAAYPITPQTHIVESLSEIVANGELDAEFICVEGEHSAMSACLGSSAAGARTFTATAGQGLELMHEVLYVASSMRLPIVLTVANRALSSPLSVWGDHSDAMSVRDTGWIQLFAENGQQVFDLVLCAFRIGEDPKVLFPVMLHMDGFHLTHVIEAIELPDQEQVDCFLPELKYPLPLDPDRPVAMGDYAPPYIYTETKKAQEEAFINSKETILKAWSEFKDIFGREYKPVESYQMKDAEIALLTMGSISESAMNTIDKLREEGEKIGLVRIRLWRPFPREELREAVKNVKALSVLDRAFSFGASYGPVYMEIRSALCDVSNPPKMLSFIGGLGGRDLTPENFEYMIQKARDAADGKPVHDGYETVGVRE